MARTRNLVAGRGRASGQRQPVRPAAPAGKRVAAKIGVFALAQGGERVEPFEFGIDKARDGTSPRRLRGRLLEELREQIRAKSASRAEIIGAGKGRIGRQCRRSRRGARNSRLSAVEHQAFDRRGGGSGSARPHWRTQACGAIQLAASSSASRTCGNRCTC